MANLTSSSYSRVVISPSLLKSLTIHPVAPCFRLGMDEWVDDYHYIKTIEGSPSLASAEKNVDSSPSASEVGSSLRPPTSQPRSKEYGGGRKRTPLQPHPQNISKRFRTLSSEELETFSKPFVPKNTETSTRWALENFHCCS